jgi:hypothetical protein
MLNKKVISKNATEKKPFFHFLLMFVKLFLLITFFWCIFLHLFQRIRNQREILRFLISFLIFFIEFFWVILALFANFEAECAKNGSKNQKNVFCKCVLDFIFAPIKGSVFFNFLKKSNSLYPTLPSRLKDILICEAELKNNRTYL